MNTFLLILLLSVVILLLVLPFIAVATTFGQKISYGVHTGINISGYHGGDANRVYDNSTKVGGEVGGDFNYHFTPHWMLMSGLNFAQSGGRFAVMSPYAMSAYAEEFKEVNTRVLSFEIPLKIGYDINLGHNFSIIPNVGMFARYTVATFKSNIILADGSTQKWNSTKDFDKGSYHIDAFKRFDYGLVGGIDFRFANHYSVSANYKLGLKDQQTQYNLKSNSLNLSVGYIW